MKLIESKSRSLESILESWAERAKRGKEASKPAMLESSDEWPGKLKKLPNGVLASPKLICNSAIFSVRNKTEPRHVFKNERIFSFGGVEITCSGIELRAYDDQLILLVLIHISKFYPPSSWIDFTPYLICKLIGWPTSGQYYVKVYESLNRFKSSIFLVKGISQFKEIPFSLIEDFEYSDNNHRIKMNQQVASLFQNGDFSYIPWDEYKCLTPTARKIFDYASSHKKPYALSLLKLKSLCFSKVKTMKKWKQQVNLACRELESYKLVETARAVKCNDEFYLFISR